MGLSSSSIQVTWTDNASDETGYEIQAASLYWGSWVTVGTVGADVTSFTETGMSTGASFQYRVRALGAAGDSSWSGGNPAFATTVRTHDGSTPYHISTYQDSNGGFYDYEDGLSVWQDQTWWKYTNVNFSSASVTGFSAVSTGTTSGDSLEVHLDSPTGTLIGTVGLTNTGDWNIFKNDSTSLAATSGVHDVYVVYRTANWNSHNIRTISFGKDVAPVNTVPGAQVVGKNSNLVFSSLNNNAISVTDPDDDGNPIKVTITVTNGTLTLQGDTSGITYISGTGTGDTTMTFTGRYYQIQTALSSVQYTPASNYTGSDLLTITTDDQGYAGTGGPLSTTDTIALNVTNVFVPAPTAPVNPTVDATDHSVAIGWTDTSTSETGFEIQRSTGGYTNDWATVGTVGANVTNFTDNSVAGGAAYKYRIRAYNASGNSAWTGDWSAVVTTSYLHPVTFPWMLTNYQGTNGFQANWGSGMGGSGDGLWWRYSQFDFSSAPVTSLSIVDIGLIAGNVVEVHLDGAAGPMIGQVVLQAGGDYSTPVVSTGAIQATSGIHTVYLVYRAINGWGNLFESASFGVNQAPVNTVPGTQLLLKNTALVFSAGNGNALTFADPDSVDPFMKVTITATHGTISLGGLTNVTVVTGTGTHDSTVTITGYPPDLVNALNGLTFTPDADFTGNASITLTSDDMGFVGSGGALRDTDTVSIHVLDNFNAPADPTSLQVHATSSTSIALAWVNHADNNSGFEIQRSAWGSNSWQTIAGVDANTTTYTDAGLPAGRSFQYRVRAVSDVGWSNWTSDYAVATTRVGHSVLGFYGTDVYQDSSGVGVAFGGGISGMGNGGWLMFSDFDFSAAAASSFTITYSTPGQGDFVEIRLDSPTGPSLGRLMIPSTGDWSSYQTVSGGIASATGLHDVYLVFSTQDEGPSFLGFTFASNQPPVNAMPLTQTIPEDTRLLFSSSNGNLITVSDPDAGNQGVRVTLTVSHGTLSLANGTLLTSANGDRTIALFGPTWQITDALSGLKYTPDLHYVGDDVLTVVTNDLGNTGAGGAQVTTNDLTIHVTTSLTPPTVATRAAVAAVGSSTASLSVLGADADGEQVLSYTWSAVKAPAGARVQFSANGTNAAKMTRVSVDHSGFYTFQVVISDGVSLATSSVTVYLEAGVTAPVNPAPAPPPGPAPAPSPTDPPSDPPPESHGPTSSGPTIAEPSSPAGPINSNPAPRASAGNGAVGGTGKPAGGVSSDAGVSRAPGGESSSSSNSSESGSGRTTGESASAGSNSVVAGAGPAGVSAPSLASGLGFRDAPTPAGKTITPADLAKVPQPVAASTAKPLSELVSSDDNATVVVAPAPTAIAEEIKKNEQQIEAKQVHVQRVVGTIVGVSATASSACILWIARGGSLLLSMLTSAPMWRYLDPLPVLDSRKVVRRRRWRFPWPWRRAKAELDTTDQSLNQLID